MISDWVSPLPNFRLNLRGLALVLLLETNVSVMLPMLLDCVYWYLYGLGSIPATMSAVFQISGSLDVLHLYDFILSDGYLNIYN